MSFPLPTFPMDRLEPVDQHKVWWYYRRYVEEYYAEYRLGHLMMAAYASVPAFLTPDLLYKLWQNFNQYQLQGNPQQIHRVAVSDLLLSPLCREAGYDLYEMDPELRDAFLTWLETESANPLWIKRGLKSPKEIAAFLLEYHRRPNPGEQRWGVSYAEAQTWNAYSFLDPAKAESLLLARLRKAMSENREMDALKVLDTISKTDARFEILYRGKETVALENFRETASVAGAWKALIQRNDNAFLEAFKQNPELGDLLSDDQRNGGIAVRIPKSVGARVKQITKQVVIAVVVGIDEYVGAEPLKGCVTDAQNFAQFLEEYCRMADKTLQLHQLINAEATEEKIKEALAEFKNARNGDLCFFSFSGHAHYQKGDGEGRGFVFHDTPSVEGPYPLTQLGLDNILQPILANTTAHCLLVLDTHDSPDDNKEKLNQGLLRANSDQLKGSLVMICGGQIAYEIAVNGKTSGVLSASLLEVLKEGGAALSYRLLMEKVRLRATQLHSKQTTFLEAFPASAAQFYFLSNKPDPKINYLLTFNPERSHWEINAGSLLGVTPSLDFMRTLLQTENGQSVEVSNVFADYSEVGSFEGDVSQSYPLQLLQTALPMIPIAMDTQLDDKLKESLIRAVEKHQLYFIKLTENPSDAYFVIRNQEDRYYLSRTASIFDDPFSPSAPVFQKYEKEPFEFIKQIEYIAQWRGVLEMDNGRTGIDKSKVNIFFDVREGDDERKFSLKASDPETVGLTYKKGKDGLLANPMLACSVSNHDDKSLFVNVLYLDSRYGILMVTEANLPPGESLEVLKTDTDIEIAPELLALDTTEIFDYLKVFISDQPIDWAILKQDIISFDGETRRVIETRRMIEPLNLVGKDWAATTIPLRVSIKEQDEDLPIEPPQAAQEVEVAQESSDPLEIYNDIRHNLGENKLGLAMIAFKKFIKGKNEELEAELAKFDRNDQRMEGAINAVMVNVRSGPNMSSEVVDTLKIGDRVDAFEAHEEWFRIGENRWINKQFIAIDPTPDPVEMAKLLTELVEKTAVLGLFGEDAERISRSVDRAGKRRERVEQQQSAESPTLEESENGNDEPPIDESNTEKGKVNIFISYTHKDVDLKQELDKHLSVLERLNLATIRHDGLIQPGEDWTETINQEIENADIILLLISPDYIASDFIYDVELPLAMEKQTKGKAIVVPIVMRACSWEGLPFDSLQGFFEPISGSPNKDSLYASIVKRIRELIDKIKQKQSPDFQQNIDSEIEYQQSAEPNFEYQQQQSQQSTRIDEPYNPYEHEMVWVEGGVYKPKGNPRIKQLPPKAVKMEGFYLAKNQVNVAQYFAFCEETFAHRPAWWTSKSKFNVETGSDDFYKKRGYAIKNGGMPIAGITWEDALAYCQWLRSKTGKPFRLPTKEEWGYGLSKILEEVPSLIEWQSGKDQIVGNTGSNLKVEGAIAVEGYPFVENEDFNPLIYLRVAMDREVPPA